MKNSAPFVSIVVQGRFHAFALAQALIAQGVSVQVLTSYPLFIAQRFGLPRQALRCAGHLGFLQREAYRQDWPRRFPWMERFLHRSFSRWAGRVLAKNPPDIVHPFSGVALELMQQLQSLPIQPRTLLMRGSAHIVDQWHLLNQEELRAGSFIDKPSFWMIQRELQEYRMAEKILTLSSFARDTFSRRGYPPSHLAVLPLAADTERFRPTGAKLSERLARVNSAAPLLVLGTGSFCLRKGAVDFIDVARRLRGKAKFRWVGNITADAERIAREAQDAVEFIPRVPESDLPGWYAQADIFFLPTIEDGFAVTLCQAQSGCLPILATNHCGAPDLITQGCDGWIKPIRCPDSMADCITHAHENRATLSEMIQFMWNSAHRRDWSHVAKDFMELVQEDTEKPLNFLSK